MGSSCSVLATLLNSGGSRCACCGTTTQLGCCGRPRLIQGSAYRPYDAGQLQRLDRIVALKDPGLTLQQVQTILDEVGLSQSLEQKTGLRIRVRRQSAHEQRYRSPAGCGQPERHGVSTR
jgi:hypothetical protein